MTTPLLPVALRFGPTSDGAPGVELELADGRLVLVTLDVSNASAAADRLREIVDGRINARPPSRRVLEIPLDHPKPAAVVPDLEADLATQAPL